MQSYYYGFGVLTESIAVIIIVVEYKNVSRDRLALQAGWPPGEPPGVSVVNGVNGVNGVNVVNGVSKKTRRRRRRRLQRLQAVSA